MSAPSEITGAAAPPAIGSRRLAGKRVLVARARPGKSEIAAQLAAYGAEVSESPLVTVAPPASFAALDAVLVADAPFNAIVFACAEGFESTLDRLAALDGDRHALPQLPVIAIGQRAADALHKRGLMADVVARGACKDALADHPELARGKLLVIAGEEARPRLHAELHALGAAITPIASYRLIQRVLPLPWPTFDLVIAPSSSAARNLAGSPQAELLRGRPWLAMGPHAAAAAVQLGAVDIKCAPRDDVASIVATALELLS